MPEKEVKSAVYPGTFDPVTNGHLSLIDRAAGIFDEVIVAVVKASPKDALFTYDERLELMKDAVSTATDNKEKVKVIGFEGLTADLAKELGVTAIIRGLRALSDFEYEFQMALMNRKLAREVETVFMMPALSWVYLSSSIVKDVAEHGGDTKSLVPENVRKALKKKFNSKRKSASGR